MTFCLNPDCPQPQNSDTERVCLTCGSPLLVGDRYRPVRTIGCGGFGRTLLGVDEYKPSQPPCVIKQFDPHAQGTRNRDRAAGLFRQEAERLEQLGKHPQIPDLLAHFDWNGRQYLIQEFIDGCDLEQELQHSGRFSDAQITQLLKEILPVLQFVHDRHVIHRDIKPENLIRGNNGQLYLVDFGASKLATAANLALTGTTIGSAGYAAPEQALGKATFASDLYSLGMTCVYLLTSIRPFDLYDSTDGKWIWRDYIPAESPINTNLARILDKMLEPATGRRYRSAAAVLTDLNNPRPKYKPVMTTPQPVARVEPPQSDEEKSQRRDRIRTSYVFWLLGFIFGTSLRPLKGLHRFYNGKIFTGLLWMIPIVGDVGSFVDLFLIPNMVDEHEQKIRAKLGVSESGVPLPPQSAIAQTLPHATQDELTVKLLKSASQHGGQLTVTQAVMETGLSFEKAETLLTSLVKTGYVDVDNDPVSGAVVYRFREL